MLERAAIAQTAASPVTPEARPARNRPDAPVRELASAQRAQSATPTSAPRPDLQGDEVAKPEPRRPQGPGSALTTYRDSDSGRLIVRIFDKETGAVLLEFPPEDPPLGAAPSGTDPTPRPHRKIDV